MLAFKRTDQQIKADSAANIDRVLEGARCRVATATALGGNHSDEKGALQAQGVVAEIFADVVLEVNAALGEWNPRPSEVRARLSALVKQAQASFSWWKPREPGTLTAVMGGEWPDRYVGEDPRKLGTKRSRDERDE